MTKLTLKQVNEAIKAQGGTETLRRGDSYFYFADGETHRWPSTMVLVFRLNSLSLEQWLREYHDLKGATDV